jgi:hypothetical protein
MMGLWLSDTESYKRADGEPESDSESVGKYLTRVSIHESTDTGAKGKGFAHGECSGLDIAKVISVDADGAQECRQSAHVNTPVVRAVCARVDGARLALGAIEEVVGENARVNHGKGSNDGRARRLAGLTLDDELGVVCDLPRAGLLQQLRSCPA